MIVQLNLIKMYLKQNLMHWQMEPKKSLVLFGPTSLFFWLELSTKSGKVLNIAGQAPSISLKLELMTKCKKRESLCELSDRNGHYKKDEVLNQTVGENFHVTTFV